MKIFSLLLTALLVSVGLVAAAVSSAAVPKIGTGLTVAFNVQEEPGGPGKPGKPGKKSVTFKGKVSSVRKACVKRKVTVTRQSDALVFGEAITEGGTAVKSGDVWKNPYETSPPKPEGKFKNGDQFVASVPAKTLKNKQGEVVAKCKAKKTDPITWP